MKLTNILSSTNTVSNAKADTKKAALELVSKLIAQNLPDIEYEQILECLVNREKLGSTGIGHGVAIPHGRIKNLLEPIGALIHLQNPIDFEANDNQPVDLLFVLLVPEAAEDTHLEILSEIAEKFSHKDLRNQLRQAPNSNELYNLIKNN